MSHVRILDKDETPGGTNMFYKVDHLQVFKVFFDAINTYVYLFFQLKPNDIQDKIFTSIFETSCGVVNLKNGQEYLLAGQSQNGKFRINACQAFADPDSGALRWELVDFSFRKQLETGYFNL